MKRFYYIAIKDGRSCEGIVRSKSVDTARFELQERGMEDINLALLRSDNADFINLEISSEESASY